MKNRADIYIHYGTDGAEMAHSLMKSADVSSLLRSDMHVCIKPNLLIPDSPENGAITHPCIVEGIVRYLKALGVSHITVAEGAWVGESSTDYIFDQCGYRDMAKKYGLRLVDTKRDHTVKYKFDGETYAVCESIVETDFLINVPVLKGHCQTKLTCCMKNLKGCIPDSEKRRYHTKGLSRPIAALNGIIRPDLHVIDSLCGDLTFEEGGNPVQSNRVLLGFDAVLLDSYCAKLIGFKPQEIGYLSYALKYEIGKFVDEKTEIIEFSPKAKPLHDLTASPQARALAEYIDEDGACSACYAALIFALDKTRYRGERIKIGQGYRGKRCQGLGVGKCTAGCEYSVSGCPPTALDILQMIEEMR